jgi:hypothetical protein
MLITYRPVFLIVLIALLLFQVKGQSIEPLCLDLEYLL